MGDTAPGGKIALDQRLARRVAGPLSRTPLTPNMVTAFNLAMGLAAGGLFAFGPPIHHWGAGLFALAMWSDHLDGEIARMTGRTSTFGHYFDHAAMMTTYLAMFVGAGIGLRHGWLGPWSILLGVAAGLAVVIIFSVRMWLEVRDGLDRVQQTVRGGFEIEDTLYVVAPVTWLGGLAPFVLAAGIGAPLFLLYVIWDAWRRRASPAV